MPAVPNPSAAHNWLQPPIGSLHDARWFPVDVHIPRGEVGFLHLDEDLVANSAFLDNRLAAPWQSPVWQRADALVGDRPVSDRTALLFHTSFCCSTLLARLLHVAPQVISLREPLVLRRFADAQFARFPFESLLPTCLDLLARPWHEGGAVVIKPTHVALPLAPVLMAHFGGARAIVLTSSLEGFLLSNLKKNAETQNKVPELIRRMTASDAFAAIRNAFPVQQLSFLQQVALQWFAQQVQIAKLLRRVGPARVRIVKEEVLLTDMETTTAFIADWLRLPIEPSKLRDNVSIESVRHAKQTNAGYDVAKKNHEANYLRSLYGDQILATLQWAERTLAPACAPLLVTS